MNADGRATVRTQPAVLERRSGEAAAVVKRLQDAGFTAYLAGGCVRDLVMARSPKDYDIATDARPESVVDLFPGSAHVGKAFGVVRAPCGESVFEVATFRRDGEYRDGRHPEAVTFADPETDASRRDFTINAIFYDPIGGKMVDYVGGLTDIRDRLVRAVGDPAARFAEDRLRMLRAVRFQTTLGFSMHPDTDRAIRSNAGLLGRISAERIRDEFSRILLDAQRAGDALLRLEDLGLLAQFMPEAVAMKGQAQPEEFHPEGDVLTHTALMLNEMKTSDVRFAYAVLLHDIGKPPTASLTDGRIRFMNHAAEGERIAHRILTRLRFSSEDRDAVCFMVRNHMRFGDVREMRLSTLRGMIGAETFPVEMELHRLDCLVSGGKPDNCDFLRKVERDLAAESALPRPWVTGRDIMALGVPEGREVGIWRKKAYDLQLEGAFRDRDDLLRWLALAVSQA